MVRRASNAPLLTLDLDRQEGAVPLYRQVYDQIRESVLSGRLRPGERLPSTRVLAKELDCSRNTIVGAFDQLLAEGYLEGQVGAGTYVSEILPEDLLITREAEQQNPFSHANLPGPSRRGEVLGKLTAPGSGSRNAGMGRAFVPGLPETGSFPFDAWGRLLGKLWRNPKESLLRHGASAGYPPLREAIADYLRAVRALDVSADQVFVTSGAQQALDLVARVLLDPGDQVWLENPGYSGLVGPVLASGAKPAFIPVDEEGLRLDAGTRKAPFARMAIVSPSHHYPLGTVMSLTRRLALLDWAREKGAWIVEDDYDSEYRFTGRPLAALHSLEGADGRVVYLGTFSKTLFPSIRAGYLVVPKRLVELFTRARATLEDHPAITLQPVLAAFMAEGHFAAHVRRMRALYEERQKIFLKLVDEEMNGLIEVPPSAAGLHLIAKLSSEVAARMDDKAISAKALEQRVVAPALSNYYFEPPPAEESTRQGLLLGYAALGEAEMRDGLRRLRLAIESA